MSRTSRSGDVGRSMPRAGPTWAWQSMTGMSERPTGQASRRGFVAEACVSRSAGPGGVRGDVGPVPRTAIGIAAQRQRRRGPKRNRTVHAAGSPAVAPGSSTSAYGARKDVGQQRPGRLARPVRPEDQPAGPVARGVLLDAPGRDEDRREADVDVGGSRRAAAPAGARPCRRRSRGRSAGAGGPTATAWISSYRRRASAPCALPTSSSSGSRADSIAP